VVFLSQLWFVWDLRFRWLLSADLSLDRCNATTQQIKFVLKIKINYNHFVLSLYLVHTANRGDMVNCTLWYAYSAYVIVSSARQSFSCIMFGCLRVPPGKTFLYMKSDVNTNILTVTIQIIRLIIWQFRASSSASAAAADDDDEAVTDHTCCFFSAFEDFGHFVNAFTSSTNCTKSHKQTVSWIVICEISQRPDQITVLIT